MIALEYDLTIDDFIAFNLRFMELSPHAQRQLRSFRINMSIVIPLVVFVLSALTVRPSWAVFVTMVVAGIVLWFLSPAIWNRAVRRNIRRMARDTGLGAVGRHRLELDDAGLREESPSGVMSTTWGSVLRVDETAGHAFIFFGPTQAFVIPKRVGEADAGPFLEQVRQWIQRVPVPA